MCTDLLRKIPTLSFLSSLPQRRQISSLPTISLWVVAIHICHINREYDDAGIHTADDNIFSYTILDIDSTGIRSGCSWKQTFVEEELLRDKPKECLRKRLRHLH